MARAAPPGPDLRYESVEETSKFLIVRCQAPHPVLILRGEGRGVSD